MASKKTQNRRYTRTRGLCKKVPNLILQIMLQSCWHKKHPTKDLNQDLLQEIDQAIIDGSLESLQMEICNAIQDFEISDIPFMIDD